MDGENPSLPLSNFSASYPLISKGFDHPHAQRPFFHLGIDFTDLITGDSPASLHFPIKAVGSPGHQRHSDKDDYRQPNHASQDDKRNNKFQKSNQKFFWGNDGELSYFKKIRSDAGHDLPHFGIVEKRQRIIYSVIKEIPPHIGLDGGGNDMTH